MPYTPIAVSFFTPGRRWLEVDAMMRELTTNAGRPDVYETVAPPYFDEAKRWARVQAMLDALNLEPRPVVYPFFYAPAMRWQALDAAMVAAYGSPAPAVPAADFTQPANGMYVAVLAA